ncbi:MAG: hypothetical protein ACR2M0_07225 [Chloroflexia bacterium]
MSLAEQFVGTDSHGSPERYGARVRWLAVIYIVLDLLSVVIMGLIVWRERFLVTLAQRSNVETLTLLIIFVLALFYLVSTGRGFWGALRLFRYDAPMLWTRDKKGRQAIEERKQAALKDGGQEIFACFDQAIQLQGQSDTPLRWKVGDDAGELGEIVVRGVKATYKAQKAGMSSSIFEFLASQLRHAAQHRDPDAQLEVTQWSTIDKDEASTYDSMAQAFRALQRQLGDKGPVWPTIEITTGEAAEIGEALRRLVPELRNDCFLPDVEYEVEYSVPILPEPLSFLQLSRHDSRADPVFTMGCAVVIMLAVLLVLAFIIWFPPWVPGV